MTNLSERASRNGYSIRDRVANTFCYSTGITTISSASTVRPAGTD